MCLKQIPMWDLVTPSGEIAERKQLNIPQQLKTHTKKHEMSFPEPVLSLSMLGYYRNTVVQHDGLGGNGCALRKKASYVSTKIQRFLNFS